LIWDVVGGEFVEKDILFKLFFLAVLTIAIKLSISLYVFKQGSVPSDLNFIVVKGPVPSKKKLKAHFHR
jgi:hypothetical protein